MTHILTLLPLSQLGRISVYEELYVRLCNFHFLSVSVLFSTICRYSICYWLCTDYTQGRNLASLCGWYNININFLLDANLHTSRRQTIRTHGNDFLQHTVAPHLAVNGASVTARRIFPFQLSSFSRSKFDLTAHNFVFDKACALFCVCWCTYGCVSLHFWCEIDNNWTET